MSSDGVSWRQERALRIQALLMAEGLTADEVSAQARSIDLEYADREAAESETRIRARYWENGKVVAEGEATLRYPFGYLTEQILSHRRPGVRLMPAGPEAGLSSDAVPPVSFDPRMRHFSPIYMAPGALAIARERARQIDQEGFRPADDAVRYRNGELGRAAACYLRHALRAPLLSAESYRDWLPPDEWPFEASWWKPTTPRRDMVKAGALMAAEIDRQEGTGP